MYNAAIASLDGSAMGIAVTLFSSGSKLRAITCASNGRHFKRLRSALETKLRQFAGHCARQEWPKRLQFNGIGRKRRLAHCLHSQFCPRLTRKDAVHNPSGQTFERSL
jgi:hypothetical protein